MTTVIEEPWTMDEQLYQIRMGVPQPHIMEISPHQYARMSGAAKRRYDAKRREEWDASSACKMQWHERVMAAFDAGTFTLETEGVHRSAVDAVKAELRRRDEEGLEERRKAAHAGNRVLTMEQLHVGDRVFSIMAGRYCTVTKLYRKSLHVKDDSGMEFSEWPRALQLRSWSDCERDFLISESLCIGPGELGQVFCTWPTIGEDSRCCAVHQEKGKR
jgi:hypothetical protein